MVPRTCHFFNTCYLLLSLLRAGSTWMHPRHCKLKTPITELSACPSDLSHSVNRITVNLVIQVGRHSSLHVYFPGTDSDMCQILSVPPRNSLSAVALHLLSTPRKHTPPVVKGPGLGGHWSLWPRQSVEKGPWGLSCHCPSGLFTGLQLSPAGNYRRKTTAQPLVMLTAHQYWSKYFSPCISLNPFNKPTR